MDESENQEEGSLGRHGGHTARNGLASATLPVRVVTALSVNARNPRSFPPTLILLCISFILKTHAFTRKRSALLCFIFLLCLP